MRIVAMVATDDGRVIMGESQFDADFENCANVIGQLSPVPQALTDMMSTMIKLMSEAGGGFS